MPHSGPRPTSSTKSPKPAKKRRRANDDTLNALGGAGARERAFIDPASPRRKPTLPVLRFLQRDDAEGAS